MLLFLLCFLLWKELLPCHPLPVKSQCALWLLPHVQCGKQISNVRASCWTETLGPPHPLPSAENRRPLCTCESRSVRHAQRGGLGCLLAASGLFHSMLFSKFIFVVAYCRISLYEHHTHYLCRAWWITLRAHKVKENKHRDRDVGSTTDPDAPAAPPARPRPPIPVAWTTRRKDG